MRIARPWPPTCRGPAGAGSGATHPPGVRPAGFRPAPCLFRRGPAPPDAGASTTLLVGLVIYILSDLANDLTMLQEGWGKVTWTDATYVVSYIVIASALARYFWRAPIVTAEPEGSAHSQPFTYLPYMGVILSYALLGVVAVDQWPDPMSVLAIGGILITALVVGRQIAAVRENVRLLSEQSKRENEARFEGLVRHSSDVIMIVDPDTVVRYVSPTIAQIFGHLPSEIEGKRLAELVHPDDVPRTLSFFMSVLPRGAVTAPAEWRIRHRRGGCAAGERRGATWPVMASVPRAPEPLPPPAAAARATQQAHHHLPMPNQSLGDAAIKQYLQYCQWIDAQPAGSLMPAASGP